MKIKSTLAILAAIMALGCDAPDHGERKDPSEPSAGYKDKIDQASALAENGDISFGVWICLGDRYITFYLKT